MHVGGVAAALEQRETDGIAARQKDAAGKTIAIARDPMAVAVVSNVEMMRRADASRSEIGHRGQLGQFKPLR
jgi:hypothetical protein